MANEVLIVVVDDEHVILDLVQTALEDGGFAVATASNVQDALALLADQAPQRLALVTDVNIGRSQLSGWDLAQQARELDPDIPVVYMTGASGGEWPSKGVPNSVLLTKPFAPAQVVTAVSTLLNDAGARRPT